MDNHTQPLVSVLIPLFNQERYFDSCLRSVCCQTYQNLEIIVVNDGSTDNSPDIVKLWAVDDNRIRYVSKDNEGLAIARMESYRLATGEFIAFVDSDDYLPKNAIEVGNDARGDIRQNHDGTLHLHFFQGTANGFQRIVNYNFMG